MILSLQLITLPAVRIIQTLAASIGLLKLLSIQKAQGLRFSFHFGRHGKQVKSRKFRQDIDSCHNLFKKQCADHCRIQKPFLPAHDIIQNTPGHIGIQIFPERIHVSGKLCGNLRMVHQTCPG